MPNGTQEMKDLIAQAPPKPVNGAGSNMDYPKEPLNSVFPRFGTGDSGAKGWVDTLTSQPKVSQDRMMNGAVPQAPPPIADYGFGAGVNMLMDKAFKQDLAVNQENLFRLAGTFAGDNTALVNERSKFAPVDPAKFDEEPTPLGRKEWQAKVEEQEKAEQEKIAKEKNKKSLGTKIIK